MNPTLAADIKLAADVVENRALLFGDNAPQGRTYHALAARLRAALPATEGVEPVAWANVDKRGDHHYHGIRELPIGRHYLYTAPPRPQMTEAEVRERFVANFKPQLTGAGIIWEGYIAALRDAGLVKP